MLEPKVFDQTQSVRVQVSCEGQIQANLRLLRLSLRRAFNRISWAKFTILDGDMDDHSLEMVESNSIFIPGSKILIKAGYGEELQPIFSGIVVRHGIRMNTRRVGELEVECRDEAFRMALNRSNANYCKRKDCEIIRSLISAHGLSANVDDTEFEHPELVQYYCNDWDFMLARAEFNGLLVDAADGKVSVKAALAGSEAFELIWGENLYDFEANIDARQQYREAQAVGWDPKRQAIVNGNQAKPDSFIEQGNLNGATLAKAAGAAKLNLQTATTQAAAVLSVWAKASQVKAELARIRGRLRCAGNHLAVPGALIKVKGLGERFSGKVLVCAVEHTFGEGEWFTDVEFGMDPDWHMMRDDIQSPAASGLLPGVGGLQIGVVLKLDGDPQNSQRIQIKLPVMQAETEGVWARLLQFYGSNEFGAFFLPEVGDEVIVGYLNDDPCHPVVLGSVYSGKHQPPYPLEVSNDIKAIVTRARHKLVFDEKDKILTITTPAGNTMVLNDKEKSARLQDQHGNFIQLSSDGIELNSTRDIILKASGDIKMTADMGIEAQAQMDVKAQGLNVNLEAQVGFSGKGAASAELSASGQTTVRGGLVMIN